MTIPADSAPIGSRRPRLRRAATPAGVLLGVLWVLLTVGCGGARGVSADLAPLPQPTPDPTLDAVVRGVPRSAPVAAKTGDTGSVATSASNSSPAPTPTPSRQVSVAGAGADTRSSATPARARTAATSQAPVNRASLVAEPGAGAQTSTSTKPR